MHSLRSRIDTLLPAAGLILACLTAAALGRQLTLKAVGCFVDFTAGVRDMNWLKSYGFTGYGGATLSQDQTTAKGFIHTTQLTHELCSGVCALGGFRYMALQASDWCTCDNAYGSQGSVNQAKCSQTCDGNPLQGCGGSFRNYVLELVYAHGEDLFVPGNRTLVTINNPSAPAYSTLTARSLSECTYHCDPPSACQAVIFNQQQRLCHLLEYAVVPGALSASDSGSFFVRG